MTKHPADIDAAFIQGLKDDGLDEEAIQEAANVGFHYNQINRVADAFDFPIPDPEQKRRLAAALNFIGKRFAGWRAERPLARLEDGRPRPTEVAEGFQNMLETDGVTDPALRAAVAARVTHLWDAGPDVELPDALELYVRKLALYANRIVDEDADALRAAGYDDDAIWEITMIGSFAAANVGLDAVFAALHGLEEGRSAA